MNNGASECGVAVFEEISVQRPYPVRHSSGGLRHMLLAEGVGGSITGALNACVELLGRGWNSGQRMRTFECCSPKGAPQESGERNI